MTFHIDMPLGATQLQVVFSFDQFSQNLGITVESNKKEN
nr:MAG TPA: hypothetical protein [Caudoviricetes sp.]